MSSQAATNRFNAGIERLVASAPAGGKLGGSGGGAAPRGLLDAAGPRRREIQA